MQIHKLEFEIKQAYQWLYTGEVNQYFCGMERINRLSSQLSKTDPLQGEISILQAMFQLGNMDQRIVLYEKALQLIGGKSRFLPMDKTMIYGNYQVISCCLSKPGTADQVSEKLKIAGNLYSKLSGGKDHSWNLYQAGLHYFRGELDLAEDRINEILNPSKEGINDVMIGSLSLLCDISKHRNRKEEWNFAMTGLNLARRSQDPLLSQMAEIVKTLSYLSVGLLTGIPECIRNGTLGVYMTEYGFDTVENGINWFNVSAAMAAHIEYCTYTGQPDWALQSIDVWQLLYGLKGNLIVGIYCALFRALSWKSLKRYDEMRKHLKLAVELISKDGFWMILADYVMEFEEELWKLTEHYGEKANAILHQYGDGYRKNLENIRKEKSEKTFFEGLTKREGEIAALVAKGKTNPEIARELNISQRTVKFHLLNAYGKLDIHRRTKVSEALQKREHRSAIWANEKQ